MYVGYIINKTTGLIFCQDSGCNILCCTFGILFLHTQCQGCLKGGDYVLCVVEKNILQYSAVVIPQMFGIFQTSLGIFKMIT